ncbi:hypothetical protein ACFQ5N_14090 [Lutibacter holmesii]|uniref:Uncharacterized protein n=1 Tax=Lutibacter holmesii TaxID=1137985 RepID=A0ABW3WUJ0_9FLAO
MDKKKQQYLLKKRQSLQQEIVLNKLRDKISFQIAYLKKNNFNFTLYYKNEYLTWLQNSLPFIKRENCSGQLDYQINPNTFKPNNYTFSSSKEMIDIIREQLPKVISINSLVIICYDGGNPEIEISLQTLLANPTTFINGAETWLIAKNKSVVLEYICFKNTLSIFILE